MPESEFARLSPGHGMDRVEGGQSTGWTAATANAVVRHDPTLNVPLNAPVPGVLTAAPEPPLQPPPEPPSEGERRSALAEAIKARKAALAALEAAQERRRRAEEHRAGCAADVAGFDDLDARIAAYTTETLRGESGRPDASAFAEDITRREMALAGLTAANAALATFAAEHAQATTEGQAAAAREKLAVSAVLDLERARLREAQRALEQRVDAYSQLLRWPDSAAPWARVVERLLLDPLQADLDVGAVPDAPVAEPLAPSTGHVLTSSTVVMMRPDGTSETVDIATAFARQREARLREQRPYHELEAEARARTRSVMAGDNLLSRP
jgi:hypothetical protein